MANKQTPGVSGRHQRLEDPGPSESLTQEIRQNILEYYDRAGRCLPWRQTPNPYRIWVSEAMLQQTQVTTVIPYYERFLNLFPNLAALAQAPLDQVLKAWENLGYYARARNLHRAAQMVLEQYQGKLPDQWDELIQLPGVGPYMAGAILSMAFGRRFPAVDGNVRRILARVLAVEDCIDESKIQKQLDRIASELVPEDRPGDFNQALMDIGAGLCTPRKPGCAGCPLSACCLAHENGLQEILPVRKKKGPVPRHQAAAAIITDAEGRYLVTKRPAKGFLGGLWKWPGGILLEGESMEACLRRTVFDELGLWVEPGGTAADVQHQYTHFRITIRAFYCDAGRGDPIDKGCDELAWVKIDDMGHYAFSKADRLIESALQTHRNDLG